MDVQRLLLTPILLAPLFFSHFLTSTGFKRFLQPSCFCYKLFLQVFVTIQTQWGLAHRCCSSWCQSCGDEAEDWIKIFNTNVKPNVMHWLPLHLPHYIVCLTVNAIVLFLSYLLSVQLSANTPHQLESSPIRVPEVFGQETLLRQSIRWSWMKRPDQHPSGARRQ